MASKTKTLDANGATSLPQHGAQINLFYRGVDLYEELRVGQDVEVSAGDAKATGKISGIYVGPLVDLIGPYGAGHPAIYGRAYSAVALLQAMSGDGSTPDVTKLHTVVSVQINPIPLGN